MNTETTNIGYVLSENEILNAKEVTLLELNKIVRQAAEKSVVALIRTVDGKRIKCGWIVDGYEKQRCKMHVLLNWLRIIGDAAPVVSERMYVMYFDSDVLGQLERADFETAEAKRKARTLYRRYMLFTEMLDDEIKNLLVELEANDAIERIEADKLPDVPDDVVEKHTHSEV